jgi:MFS family permease
MVQVAPVDPPTSAAVDPVFRRIAWRLLPLLVVCYVVNYVDRVNLGFAKLQMQADLGISDAAYGLAAGVFFVGYVIFEVPSNLLLRRIGTRLTITRIMVLWGLTTAATVFVQGERSLYVARFLLGVFEAGFAPGVIFFVSLWFPARQMARALSILLMTGPLGLMLGGPLSTAVLSGMDEVAGLAGWQWMFLVEAAPCLVLAAVVWRVLPDRPAEARWLSEAERRTVAAEVETVAQARHADFRQVLRDPRIYALAFGYFTISAGLYAITFWLPTILQDNGVTGTVRVGLMSAIPFALSIPAMLILARRSDSRGNRLGYCCAAGLGAAAALAVAAVTSASFAVSFVALCVTTMLMFASYVVFWAIPAGILNGDAAAGGVALINSIGLLGGFFSPTLLGLVRDATGSTEAGLLTLVVLLVVGTATIALSRTGRVAHSG